MSLKSVFGDISYIVEMITKPSANLLGVVLGQDPLRLLRPDFTTKHISQSHPLPLSSNMISLELETNCDFAIGSIVTIAGLKGTLTPDETGMLVFGGYYDDWFDKTLTSWSQALGMLKLHVSKTFRLGHVLQGSVDHGRQQSYTHSAVHIYAESNFLTF